MRYAASGTMAILAEDPTATNPVFVPNATDEDTGIGWAAADALSLVAGSVEAIRCVEDSSAATIQFGQDNYDPMIQQASGTAAGSVGYSFKADTDTGLSSGGESNSLQLVVGTIPAIHCRKDDDTGVAYVGIGGSAYDASVNNTLLQLNGDSDEAELAFKLSGGTTTTMGYRGQAVFSIDANGGFQIRNQGGSKRAEVDTSGNFTTFHTTTVQDDNLQVQANSADAVSKSLIFKNHATLQTVPLAPLFKITMCLARLNSKELTAQVRRMQISHQVQRFLRGSTEHPATMICRPKLFLHVCRWQ